MHDLLDLIEMHMLVVESSHVPSGERWRWRISASLLVETLESMHQRAGDDEDYILVTVPREQHSTDSAIVSRMLREEHSTDPAVVSETLPVEHSTDSAVVSGILREEHSTDPAVVSGTLTEEHSPVTRLEPGTQSAAVVTAMSDEVPLRLLKYQRGSQGTRRTKSLRFLEQRPTSEQTYVREKTQEGSIGRRHDQESPKFLRKVDETIRTCVAGQPAPNACRAEFVVFWELQQCIRDELDGSPDLGPVITISGNQWHSWAASCLEYVETTWSALGRSLLEQLQTGLGQSVSAQTPSGQCISPRDCRYVIRHSCARSFDADVTRCA